MPPKKSKKKKSVERGSKNTAKGNDNQQQIVNVTVNIPRERKKEEKKKPKIDPQAVQQLEGSVQQYQALVEKAKEAGIQIPPELELNINADNVKTTQDVLALNAQVSDITGKLTKMIETPQGAGGFDQMPHSLLMGIGGVPQMKARPGFNPPSGYDNPNEDDNQKKENEKEKEKAKTLPDPVEPPAIDPPNKNTSRDMAHAFVGLADRQKPLPSFVNQGNSSLFMNFFRRVTVTNVTTNWKAMYTPKNIQANRDNGATPKDLQLAWIYSTAIRFLSNFYPTIIEDDGHSNKAYDDTYSHDEGFEVFYDNVTTFLGPGAPSKSIWNRLPVTENDTAPKGALNTIKRMFLEDVASLKDEPFYQSNDSPPQDVSSDFGGLNQLQGQINDLENQLNDGLHSPPQKRPGTHGSAAHTTPRPDESAPPQQSPQTPTPPSTPRPPGPPPYNLRPRPTRPPPPYTPPQLTPPQQSPVPPPLHPPRHGPGRHSIGPGFGPGFN